MIKFSLRLFQATFSSLLSILLLLSIFIDEVLFCLLNIIRWHLSPFRFITLLCNQLTLFEVSYTNLIIMS